jgi:hypothetical protein
LAKLAVAKRALAVSPVSAQLVQCEASSQQQSARVSSSVSRARSGSTCCCTDETIPRTKVAISVSSGVLKIFKSAERESASSLRKSSSCLDMSCVFSAPAGSPSAELTAARRPGVWSGVASASRKRGCSERTSSPAASSRVANNPSPKAEAATRAAAGIVARAVVRATLNMPRTAPPTSAES